MSDATDTTAAPAKKKGKLPLIILALAVLLAGGGGAYVFLIKGPSAAAKDKKAGKGAAGEDEEAPHEEGAEEGDEGEAAAEGKGGGGQTSKTAKLSLPKDEGVKAVVELQPFIVNLADTEEARYLRLTVSLGLAGEAEEKTSSLFTTRVRNALLAVLTTKRSDDILSVEGKDRLRKELLKAAKAASHEPVVEAIYITDFIVQL